ncbi:MAG TPA: polysaccharide deacetylase family protein [Planctomycetota bacterium]|nr:polysaccharide deacetylase family protein [Planctomycetota bacterium]
MAGVRPLPPEAMVWGSPLHFAHGGYVPNEDVTPGGTWGIERLMDCFDARGLKATFFVSTLEELHHGEEHVKRICSAVLDRGHDAQLHLHPNWWKGDFARKRLTDYSLEEQTELVRLAKEAYRRACGSEPVAHRAGGLLVNADTFRALAANGIPMDSSVAIGHIPYELGEGVTPPNVPRRLGSVIEVPVTTFAQMRLGPWAPRRHFDLNADSLSELKLVVDRAVQQGAAAACLLMHSFSLIARNREGTEFRPAEAECRKLERFLDYIATRGDVEVVTVREVARRIEGEPALLAGPDLEATAGVFRTWRRSCERFGAGWKSKAFALGLPLGLAALAALVIGAIWWLTS